MPIRLYIPTQGQDNTINKPPSDEDWITQHSEFIRSAAGNGTARILDLGCGRGRDVFYLRDYGDVVAADLNMESLRQCESYAQPSQLVCLDLATPLPFADSTFDFILASLSLHYFSWTTTQQVLQELRRCLKREGRSIIRLNSTNDINYGAQSHDVIETNYFNVGKQTKRFFSAQDIRALFGEWHTDSIRELVINRYAKLKTVWEIKLNDNHNLSIETATASDLTLIHNLLNHYLYDMSEWFKFDPDNDGFFSYDIPAMESDNHFIYIARYGDSPAGIALVTREDEQFDMHEFFVLRRYRGTGTAQYFFADILKRLPGKWQVRVFAANKPAMPFWKRAIADVTDNQYQESHPDINGQAWVHYHFQVP